MTDQAKLHPVHTDIVEPQVLFDFVVGHIVQQGRPSIAPEEDGPIGKNQCLYRGSSYFSKDDPSSCMSCAIGALLTDEEAEGLDFIIDSADVETLYELRLLPERLEPHIDLMTELQKCHDYTAQMTLENPEKFLPHFLSQACSIAEDFDLKIPEATA